MGIFFDDNIDLADEVKNIISPIDVKTSQPISIADLANRNQIVCVNTLEAILNEDYFVELVKKAIKTK